MTHRSICLPGWLAVSQVRPYSFGLIDDRVGNNWKSDFVKSLPDEALDTHIAQAAKAPSELSLMHLYPIDGAVHRVPKDATAWNAREATWSMVIAGIDSDPKQADALKRWGRAYWGRQ